MARNGEACRLHRRPSDYSLRDLLSPTHHKCADNDCCVPRPVSRVQTIILLQLLCHERQLAGKTVFADAYRHSRTRSYRYLVPSKMTNVRSLIVVWRSPHRLLAISRNTSAARGSSHYQRIFSCRGAAWSAVVVIATANM